MTPEEIVPLAPYIIGIAAILSAVGIWWFEKVLLPKFGIEPNHTGYEREVCALDPQRRK